MPVALVTGASRGVGRGIAVSLAEAGFHVFATGRSVAGALLPAAVERVPCDHTVTAETDEVFRRIAERGEGLDLLVKSAWGGYERMVDDGRFTWGVPFWEQPAHRWTSMMDAGVRAAFECSARAARVMIQAPLPVRRGLIVNIGFWAAQKYIGNAIYGVAKAATDKLTHDMAHELRGYGVAVVSLYPGLVRTESVLAAAKEGWIDLAGSESPEFSGLVIAALARDPEVMGRTGQVLVGAAVAAEYGVCDVDGARPAALTLERV